MKMRLLLILAVGIAFSPSVFASVSSVGPFNRGNDAGTAGAVHCKAGHELKELMADNEGDKKDAPKQDTKSGAGEVLPGGQDS